MVLNRERERNAAWTESASGPAVLMNVPLSNESRMRLLGSGSLLQRVGQVVCGLASVASKGSISGRCFLRTGLFAMTTS